MQYHGDRDRRTVPDDGAAVADTRRMMVMRLRVEITMREAAQPSDPRIEDVRSAGTPLGRRWRLGRAAGCSQ